MTENTRRYKTGKRDLNFRPRLTGETRREVAVKLRERYEKGESIRTLAVEMDLSYGTARSLILDAGATLRPRGGTPVDE